MKMRVASQLQIQGRGPTPKGRGGNQLRLVNAFVDLRRDARDAPGVKFFRFHADFRKFGKIVY